MNFPDLNDIILTIIIFLPIPDTRNLIRCNKKLNSLCLNKNILYITDINSLIWEKKINSEIDIDFFNYLGPIKQKNLSEMENIHVNLFVMDTSIYYNTNI